MKHHVYGKNSPMPAFLEGVCDFAIDVQADRPVRILQLTDMQIIDSAQQRYIGRLSDRETECWTMEHVDKQAFDHIRSLVAQTSPDLVIITGDIIYGEFDDDGSTLIRFRDFMDSLSVPWAPVYGNHDNESLKGVAWQSASLENGRYCLFKRGSMTGNGNYSILLMQNGKPIRTLYMLDSHGCGHTTDPEAFLMPGIFPDQLSWMIDTSRRLADLYGETVRGFVACHLPSLDVAEALEEKGYTRSDRPFFTLGVDVQAEAGDFGGIHEPLSMLTEPQRLAPYLHDASVNGVFVGHNHANNTSILYKDIRWTFGLKTGQHDYHAAGQLGGTLITLDDRCEGGFAVAHVPALVLYGEFPKMYHFDR